MFFTPTCRLHNWESFYWMPLPILVFASIGQDVHLPQTSILFFLAELVKIKSSVFQPIRLVKPEFIPLHLGKTMIFAEWNGLKITLKCAKGHSIFKVWFSVWIWKHPMGSLVRYNEKLQISSELSVWHFVIVFSRKGGERAVGKGNWKLLFRDPLFALGRMSV